MASSGKLTYGSYEVLQNPDGSPCTLGEGSFGITYKARHIMLGRINALKVIREDLLNRSSKQDQEETNRFLSEARAVGKLHHPGIAMVHDCALDNGVFYYAMEYCDGGTLQSLCDERGPLPWSEVRQIALQIASALDYAHASGFLHRDIKPANIMLNGRDKSRQAKLIDFGLAKQFTSDSIASSTTVRNDQENFRGNFATASPEQILEKPLDQRSDLFSLGVTFWWLLIGKNPFGEMKRGPLIADRVAPSSYASVLPADLEPEAVKLLTGLLEKDADNRISSAREVVEMLSPTATPVALAAAPPASPAAPLEPLASPPDFENGYVHTGTLASVSQAKLYVGKNRSTHQPVVAIIPFPSLDADALGGLRVAADRKLDFGAYAMLDWCLLDSDDVFVVSKPEGCSLLAILRKFGPAKFTDALPLLAHLARCFDASQAWTTFGIQVDPGEILLRTRDGGLELERFRAWSDLDPHAARCLPLFTSDADHADSSEATLSTSAQEFQPLAQFAALVYRVLAGSVVRYAAFFTTSGYVMASGLSEDGNALLADTICAPETQPSACHFLQVLASMESLAVAELTPLIDPPTSTDIEIGKLTPTPSHFSVTDVVARGPLLGGSKPAPFDSSMSVNDKVAALEQQLALAKEAAEEETRREAAAKQQAAEQARQQQEEAKRQAEEAKRQAEEAKRAAAEAARQQQEAAKRQAEDAKRAAAEAARQQQEAAKRQAEEAKRAAAEAARQTEEAKRQAAAEQTRQAAAAKQAAEEARRKQEDGKRLAAEDKVRQQAESKRLAEEQARQASEAKRAAEAKRLADEQARRKQDDAKRWAAEEQARQQAAANPPAAQLTIPAIPPIPVPQSPTPTPPASGSKRKVLVIAAVLVVLTTTITALVVKDNSRKIEAAKEEKRQAEELLAKEEALQRQAKPSEDERLAAEQAALDQEKAKLAEATARRDKEAQAKIEAAEKAIRDAEKAKSAAEEKIRLADKLAAEDKAKRDKEAQAKIEAAEKVARDAEKAKLTAEEKTKREAEEKTKREAELARLAAEEKTKREAELARLAAEDKAKREAEQAKREAEEKAKLAATPKTSSIKISMGHLADDSKGGYPYSGFTVAGVDDKNKTFDKTQAKEGFPAPSGSKWLVTLLGDIGGAKDQPLASVVLSVPESAEIKDIPVVLPAVLSAIQVVNKFDYADYAQVKIAGPKANPNPPAITLSNTATTARVISAAELTPASALSNPPPQAFPVKDKLSIPVAGGGEWLVTYTGSHLGDKQTSVTPGAKDAPPALESPPPLSGRYSLVAPMTTFPTGSENRTLAPVKTKPVKAGTDLEVDYFNDFVYETSAEGRKWFKDNFENAKRSWGLPHFLGVFMELKLSIVAGQPAGNMIVMLNYPNAVFLQYKGDFTTLQMKSADTLGLQLTGDLGFQGLPAKECINEWYVEYDKKLKAGNKQEYQNFLRNSLDSWAAYFGNAPDKADKSKWYGLKFDEWRYITMSPKFDFSFECQLTGGKISMKKAVQAFTKPELYNGNQNDPSAPELLHSVLLRDDAKAAGREMRRLP
jgi:serine/threonine protein kinase